VRKLLGNKNAKTILFLLFLLGLWETLVSLKLFSPLLFPSLRVIVLALFKEIKSGEIFVRAGYSLYLIFTGILISLFLALVLTILSGISRTIQDLVSSIASLVDPLPGIALLPFAILWFGIGEASIIFIIVHSILWPLFLNTSAGFRTVPLILTEIGKNIGLSGIRLRVEVYLPASLPNILVGLRTGWSRAWRALISAEMVFGATGLSGGLGWDIFKKRSFMDIPGLYSTLFVIMIIGLLIEEGVFKIVEENTVKKWGMVR
jgi:NitT/TauT family transport system permease protein